MQNSLVLKCQIREKTGTRAAQKMRKAGMLPATMYGHKQEPMAVGVNEHDFVEIIHHGHRVIDIELDGKKQTVMVKDLQYDAIGRYIVHADFVRVDVTESVKVSVPISLKGVAKGAADGGIVAEQTDQIEVECRVTDIPDAIEVSVKDLGIDEAIHAGQITLPEGVVLVSDPDLVIATCHMVAAAVSAEGEMEEGGPAEPEVIGGKKEEEAAD